MILGSSMFYLLEGDYAQRLHELGFFRTFYVEVSGVP